MYMTLHTEADVRPDLINMNDLFEQHKDAPPPTWMVEGLLRSNKGRPSLLCGYPHAGKSTLARQLAIAVSKGGSFLGRKTTRSRVLYWYCEDSPLDAALDFKKQGADSNDMITLMRPTKLALRERLAEIETALHKAYESKRPYGLVVIETICDLLQPGNENDNAEVSELLSAFIDDIVSKFHGSSFLMLHHFNKSTDAAVTNNGLLRVSGARAFTAKSDAKLLMYSQSDLEPKRIFATKVRDGWDTEPTYLEFDTQDNTSTLGLKVVDVAIAAKESQKLTRQMQLDASILKLIDTPEGKGIGKSTIRQHITGKTEVVTSAIERLIQQGHVRTMKHGKKVHCFTAAQAEKGEMTIAACESWADIAEKEEQ